MSTQHVSATPANPLASPAAPTGLPTNGTLASNLQATNGTTEKFAGTHGHGPRKKSGSALGVIAGVTLAVLLLAIGGGLITYFATDLFSNSRADLLLHTVGYEMLEVTIVERGTLEAAENKDVICQVKSGGRGSNFATTIKWIIDDGAHVKKGEKIIELDKSGLEDQERTQRIAVERARADAIAAVNQLEIVRSQNDSALSKAEIDLKLAKLDYDKYMGEVNSKSGQREGGEYQAIYNDLSGQIKQAESDVGMMKERASWAERMFLKKYYSESQSEAELNRLRSSELKLNKLRDDFNVLKITKIRQETDLMSKQQEAERALSRVKTENLAKLTTALSDVKTKCGGLVDKMKDAQKVIEVLGQDVDDLKKDRDVGGLLGQEIEKLKEIQEQITYCTIVAPQDGMVVYNIPEQSRSSFGGQQSTIAQGEQVREGQRLVRIPNLTHMLVNTKVHEAMVSRVKPGMRVDIRVDSVPDRVLKGRVRSVAPIAAQNDWRAADVKMYQTMISIDETFDGLKPGMSAECVIHVTATDGKVLTLPIQGIVGGAEMGNKRKCFVQMPDGRVEERDIDVGLSNEKIAEVRSGLKEGEEVVLNPRVLLGDKDKTKTRVPGEFERQGNGNGEKPKGELPPPGDPKANPAGTQPGVQPGTPAGAGPQGGLKGKGKWDPKMLDDPEVQKKLRERGIDPEELKKKAGFPGGGPGGGGFPEGSSPQK